MKIYTIFEQKVVTESGVEKIQEVAIGDFFNLLVASRICHFLNKDSIFNYYIREKDT